MADKKLLVDVFMDGMTRAQKWLGALIVLFITVALMVLVLSLPYQFYLYVNKEKPQERKQDSSQPHQAAPLVIESAGSVIALTLTGDILVRTLVLTDTGFYALAQAISLKKGEPLTLETRNTDRYLCDSTHRCTPLL